MPVFAILANILDNLPRSPKNTLTLQPLADGRFRLFGHFLGKKVRIQSSNREKLLQKKHDLERQLVPAAVDNHTFRNTWLSEAQLRDAEAATLRANGRSLLDCVSVAKRGDEVQRPMKREAALLEWLSHLEHRLRRFPATLAKNRHRMEAFFESVPAATHVHNFKPEDVDAWVFRKGVSASTQLTDATVIGAFFKFARKFSWVPASPMSIDMKELAGRAHRTERARILTPEQCSALLKAAEGHEGGALVPFVLLSTWCFLRNAEALRVRPEDIDWMAEAPAVTIEPRKRRTVSYRRVPIPKNALRRLRKHRAEKKWTDGATVFWSRRDWDEVRRLAGLIDLAPAKNPKQATHGRVIDSLWQENILRHTGISYRYQETGDIGLVTREAGNSSATAFDHYIHLPRQGAAKAFYSV